MSKPTVAPPGWYLDPNTPGRARYWDGYGYPDQGVTVCADAHEAPLSAVFCPECGLPVGVVKLESLTGRPVERREGASSPPAARPS
jgi:Protein of unknown function (DUF2510)